MDRRLRDDLDDERQQAADAAAPPETESAPLGVAEAEAAIAFTTPTMTGTDSAPELVGDPANDPGVGTTVTEPMRRYADAVGQIDESALTRAPTDEMAYQVADFSHLDHSVEPERFYDASYRPALAAMVAHVIAVEAPLFEDVLVRRIARAHGLLRAGQTIRAAVVDRIDPAVVRTEENGRLVLWPRAESPRDMHPFRTAEAAARSHADTPMAELVGLAHTLRSSASESERVRLMAARFGLSRVEASTRARFERASQAARGA